MTSPALFESLWELFTMLANGVDEDQVVPALLLHANGFGRFCLDEARVRDVQYPPWVVHKQRIQAEWLEPYDGIRKLSALLRRKLELRGDDGEHGRRDDHVLARRAGPDEAGA